MLERIYIVVLIRDFCIKIGNKLVLKQGCTAPQTSSRSVLEKPVTSSHPSACCAENQGTVSSFKTNDLILAKNFMIELYDYIYTYYVYSTTYRGEDFSYICDWQVRLAAYPCFILTIIRLCLMVCVRQNCGLQHTVVCFILCP